MKKSIIILAIRIVEWLNQATTDSVTGLFATFKLSLILTPFIFILEKITKWGVDNDDYILIVMGAILVDWLFGSIKHSFLFHDNWSWKRNAIGLSTKFALATAGGFLFEGLNFIVKDADYVFVASKIVTRVIILMYPAISAFENIYIVSGEKFPPKAWMERLYKWKTSLNPKDLMEDENRKNNFD